MLLIQLCVPSIRIIKYLKKSSSESKEEQKVDPNDSFEIEPEKLLEEYEEIKL